MLSELLIKFILSPAGLISLVPCGLFLSFIVKSMRYLWSLPHCTIEKARKTMIVSKDAKRDLLMLVFIDALYFISWNAPPLQSYSVSMKWLVLAAFDIIMLYMSLFSLVTVVVAK
jgi:hypothetical protein